MEVGELGLVAGIIGGLTCWPRVASAMIGVGEALHKGSLGMVRGGLCDRTGGLACGVLLTARIDQMTPQALGSPPLSR